MSQDKYIILKLGDVKQLAVFLRENISECTSSSGGADTARLEVLTERFEAETGADIEEIVSILKNDFKYSLKAPVLGRRIERLLVRAGYVREPKQLVAAPIQVPLGKLNVWDFDVIYKGSARVLTYQDKVDAVMAHYGCSLYTAYHFMDLREEGLSEDMVETMLSLKKASQ